jgi:hypothetical protein
MDTTDTQLAPQSFENGETTGTAENIQGGQAQPRLGLSFGVRSVDADVDSFADIEDLASDSRRATLALCRLAGRRTPLADASGFLIPTFCVWMRVRG